MSSACLIQFLLKDIAEWLHPSDFYQLLLQLSHDAEEDDLITVPYYEISPVIQRGEEETLKRVLQTCRYWGLEMKDWPDELCYILWGKGGWNGIDKIVDQLYPTMTIGNNNMQIMLEGNLRALQYLHEHHVIRWHPSICIYAVENGQLECLQYAHEHGCPWNENTCSHAALHGQLECLKYAHEHGCPWYESTCSGATLNGHFECLQYALEHGCPIYWKDCLIIARNRENENILHYLLDHLPQ